MAEDADAFRFVQQTLVGDAIGSSDHAVFVSEEDFGRVVAVNDAATRLTGYSREELLAMRAGDYSARSRDEVAAVYARLKGRKPVYDTARLRRKDGSVVEIAYWGSHTRVAGIDFLLTVTEPVQLAREVDPEQ